MDMNQIIIPNDIKNIVYSFLMPYPESVLKDISLRRYSIIRSTIHYCIMNGKISHSYIGSPFLGCDKNNDLKESIYQ